MQNLKELLISLQTFDFKMLSSKQLKNDPHLAKTGLPMYDIVHQTSHSEFRFNQEKLLDLATVDLIMLDNKRINLILKELHKIKERFKTLWVQYNVFYRGRSFAKYHSQSLYWDDYFSLIGLPNLFYVKNLSPPNPNIYITGKFIDDLGDSLKWRESLLNELIEQTSSLVEPENEPKPVSNGGSAGSGKKIANAPVFVDGIAEKFFEICKSYFSPHDQRLLLFLLKKNEAPTFPLLFRGNGNQLVDAFKQVYEANLVVGCQKVELEDWIGANFEYLYRNEQKTFPANYLNAIISSNSKPCQSPILDVKRQPDGTYNIIPVIRTKKNYISGS